MVNISVSLGEAIDRLTILEIKQKMISDPDKLIFIERELEALNSMLDWYCECFEVIIPEILKQKLYAINLSLWNIENNIRIKEKKLEFDDEFIQLARSVYMNNDLRYQVKKEICEILVYPDFMEQKSYA